MSATHYLQGFPERVIEQALEMKAAGKLKPFLLSRYPTRHQYQSDKALSSFVMELKNRYLKSSKALHAVRYDSTLELAYNALGIHSSRSRVHGKKLKAKREILIATAFKEAPEPFLRMIAVHELAHLREFEHNKAFYKLCTHMEPSYWTLERDMRLLLMLRDTGEKLYR